MNETAFDIEMARGIVDKIFSTRISRGGQLTRVDAGRELLPETLFAFSMLNEVPERLGLQLFKGLGSVGEMLWQHELRSLRCLSALRESALPRVIEGHFDETDDVAYVITETSELTLASPGVNEFLSTDGQQGQTLVQLRLLLSALRRLHARGLLHRNVVPEAIEALVDESEDTTVRLRLARFEMSTLVGNVLRLRAASHPDAAGTLQASAWANASYLAPERLGLLAHRFGPVVDNWRADVYGLGMIAYSWFVLKGALTSSDVIDQYTTAEQAHDIFRRRDARVAGARELPRDLRELIGKMLDPDWRTRLTAQEAHDLISTREAAIANAFARQQSVESRTSMIVSIAPDHFNDTLVKWAGLSRPVDEPTKMTLRQFIEADLAEPGLTYFQGGYAMFSHDGGDASKKAEAGYVLLGTEYLYFCTLYQAYFGGQTYPEVLHIRWVLQRHLSVAARALARAILIPLEKVEVVFNSAVSEVRRNRRSWQPLLSRVARQPSLPERRVQFEEAFDWLLDVSDALLSMRQYPCTAVRVDAHADIYVLTLASDVLKLRNRKLPLLNACGRVRPAPPFGAFFQSLDANTLHVWPRGREEDFRPIRQRDRRATVELIKPTGEDMNAAGQDRIVVRLIEGALPTSGWVMAEEDEGSFELWLRQRRARDQLFEMDSLVDQLQLPTALFTERADWKGIGDGLDGSAPQVIQHMLNAWPFFAVHGPPGTGKTTVTARAVAAVLSDDKSQRILIASQSHDSLDNITERIRGELRLAGLENQIVALRVASAGTEWRVSESVSQLLPRKMAERRLQLIQQHVDDQMARTSDPAVHSILSRWRSQCESCVLELSDRFRRGANIVFATCGSATERNLSVAGADDVFDWVIVEEAARAWPTEVALALVRGTRWTLIGDHLQLKAFGRPDIEAILKACQKSNDEMLRERTADRDRFVDVFDFFAKIFDGWNPAVPAAPNRPRRPCGVLNMQFRMADPIGALVSEVFYKETGVETGASAERSHGLTEPPVVAGRRLIWLDTGHLDCTETGPRWKNPKEALIVRALIQELRRNPPSKLSVAVLTPYWAQVHELRQMLEPYGIPVQTTDSYQGKEADVVVVSLVRSNHGNVEVSDRIGFLSDPARVNVMFSRARQLLVVVGNRRHFARSIPSIWSDVTEAFQRLGHIEPADRLLALATKKQGEA